MRMSTVVLAVVAVGAVVTGCARSWDGDLRFEVVAFHDGYESMGRVQGSYANIKMAQDHPDAMVENVTMQAVDRDQLPAGIRIGEQVVCAVRQYDKSGFDQEGVRTDVDRCRRP